VVPKKQDDRRICWQVTVLETTAVEIVVSHRLSTPVSSCKTRFRVIVEQKALGRASASGTATSLGCFLLIVLFSKGPVTL
jgi:hypothetical protein